jgi:hypothetical protein
MLKLFPHGPFESLAIDGRCVVVETDVQRLLAWGRSPVASNEHNARLLDASRRFHLTRKPGWYGAASAEEVLSLRGWPEGLEIAQRYATMLPEFSVKQAVRAAAWSDDGDEFCRDRFDAGLEDPWRTRKRLLRPTRPILKLTCAIGGNCNRSADELIWMGAAAFAMVDAAERAGYRIEVEACSPLERAWLHGRTITQCLRRIRVKAADDALDRETTVMVLACPMFFRWYVIQSLAAVTPDRNIPKDYGCTMPVPSAYHGDLHMPHAYSFEQARRACEGLIAQIERMAAEAA